MPRKAKSPGLPRESKDSLQQGRWAALAGRYAGWLVAGTCLIVYANTLGHDLLWDDTRAIQGNPLVASLDLGRIFSTAYWYPDPKLTDLYRPLTVLSYALNHLAAGFQPWIYHLTNVLLHALNSVLVLKLTRRFSRSDRFALIAALVFALHPLHSEAVAWVSGRAELLACAFILSAWLCLPEEKGDRAYWPRAAIASLVYLLGLLSKESSVILIPVVWCVRAASNALVPESDRQAPMGWGRVLRRSDLALAASVAAMLALRVAVLGQAGPKTAETVPFVENPLAYAGSMTRILTAFKLLGLYLWKMLFPIRLSSDYSFNQIPVSGWNDPWMWVSVGALAACAVYLIQARFASWPAAGLLVSWIALAVVCQLFFPSGALFAERLAYFPLLGFSISLAGLFQGAGQRHHLKPAAGVVLSLLLLGYAARTLWRNGDWKDAPTFFAAMARDAPHSAKALLQGGLALADTQPAAALPYLEKALQIHPQYLQGLLGLAQAEINSRRFAEAEESLQQALRLDPASIEALQALCRSYRGSGKFELALETSERILSLEPADSFALAERAIALDSLKRSGEALEAYRKAIREGADSSELRNRLGSIYLQQGEPEAAVEQFAAAARIEPSDPVTYFNLADAYRRKGQAQLEADAYQSFLQYWRGDPRVAADIRRRLETLRAGKPSG